MIAIEDRRSQLKKTIRLTSNSYNKRGNAQPLFSSCECTQEVKLNIEWQMALLSKKVNMDFTDEISSFAVNSNPKSRKFQIL